MPKEIDKETLFPQKLNDILHSQEAKDFISWKKQSNTIEVTDLKGFQQNVLPLYFRHGRFQSFVRQMNLYGFKKHRNSKTHIFTHEMMDTEFNLLSLKSRYQKRRQSLIEQQNQQKQLSIQPQNEKKSERDFNGNNSIDFQTVNRSYQGQNINVEMPNQIQYENFILNNSFPFMNSFCFYGWNQSFPQFHYLGTNQF